MTAQRRDALLALLQPHRVFVIVGPYGTGKTEVAVNLALQLSLTGRRTALADLDFVNPYFRSREREQVLLQHQVRLIAPPHHVSAADLPAVPQEVLAIVHDQGLSGVIDVGGEHHGATVLRQFAKQLRQVQPQLWYVLNLHRLGGGDVAAAVNQLRQVEAHSGLHITGLVNNTHLLHDTDLSVVLTGADFAQAVARETGLPLVMHAMRRDLAAQVPQLAPILPLDLYNKRPWE